MRYLIKGIICFLMLHFILTACNGNSNISISATPYADTYYDIYGHMLFKKIGDLEKYMKDGCPGQVKLEQNIFLNINKLLGNIKLPLSSIYLYPGNCYKYNFSLSSFSLSSGGLITVQIVYKQGISHTALLEQYNESPGYHLFYDVQSAINAENKKVYNDDIYAVIKDYNGMQIGYKIKNSRIALVHCQANDFDITIDINDINPKYYKNNLLLPFTRLIFDETALDGILKIYSATK